MIPLIGLTAGFWLLAVFLNNRILLLRRLQLPDSLLAGLFLLLLGPQVAGLLPRMLYDNWKDWPGTLIAFLFSALILEPLESLEKGRTRPVLAQGLYVWMLAFLQLALGYAVSALFASPKDRLIAHVIELSWLGGYGSASAFIPVSERLGSRMAGDLALGAATIGLLWGSVSGLFIAAYHRRELSRRSREDRGDATASVPVPAPEIPLPETASNEKARLVSFALPVIPVFAAYLVREGLSLLAGMVHLTAATRIIEDLPLFFLVIVIAYFLKPLVPKGANIESIRLFHHLSLEGLILSAMATLSLTALRDHLDILLILTAGAAALSLFCHFVLSPRLLPRHPDLSLINYGMATGTTALGLMLLRTYREHPDVRALEIYGLAAPLSAPFIGGGIISLFLLPELTVRVAPALLFLFSIALAILSGFAARFVHQRD